MNLPIRLGFAFLAVFMGCAATLNPIQTFYTQPNGVSTDQHPAVGELFWGLEYNCNAILISETVALTADHCTADWPVGSEKRATVVFGGKQYKPKAVVPLAISVAGRTDVSAIILTRRVIGIKPIKVASDDPKRGDVLAFVGRGCSSFESLTTGSDVSPVGTKRHVFFTVGYEFDYDFVDNPDLRLCPGDSGGALIRLSDYSLVGIGSAKIYSSSRDYVAAMFGDPKLFLKFISYGILYSEIKSLLSPILKELT